MQRGDAMNDTAFWSVLAIVVLIAIALGALLFMFGAAPLFGWTSGTEALTVSSVPAVDNCDDARTVGDNACNATISELPWSSTAAMLLGGFMVVIGLLGLVQIAVVSR